MQTDYLISTAAKKYIYNNNTLAKDTRGKQHVKRPNKKYGCYLPCCIVLLVFVFNRHRHKLTYLLFVTGVLLYSISFNQKCKIFRFFVLFSAESLSSSEKLTKRLRVMNICCGSWMSRSHRPFSSSHTPFADLHYWQWVKRRLFLY